MQAGRISVLTVSPNDCGGGAEKTAAGLHAAFLERGLDSWLALSVDHGVVPDSLRIPNTEHRGPWARRVLTGAGLADPGSPPSYPRALQLAARLLAEPARYARVLSGLEDFDFPATALIPSLPPRTPDVLHLHNLHGAYFDIRQLPALSAALPTILTMHDAWLLTGHCAQPMECPGWRKTCLTCPYLDRYVPIRRDRAADNNRIKREALAGGRVHLASPSRWLADMAVESGHAALAAEVRVIPNGVDTDVFRPGDRALSRAGLGLPADALIVLFAARSVSTSEFKGFETLEAALPAIAAGCDPGRELLLVALGAEGPDADLGGARVRFVPFVDDPAAVAEYYRAADVYLHPSRAESFGLAVLEAMACGTPVVASNVGGIPEIVQDGVSGLLVAVGDADALAAAALCVLNDRDLSERLAAAGALRARTVFPFARQVDAYLDWYAELIETADAASQGSRT